MFTISFPIMRLFQQDVKEKIQYKSEKNDKNNSSAREMYRLRILRRNSTLPLENECTGRQKRFAGKQSQKRHFYISNRR